MTHFVLPLVGAQQPHWPLAMALLLLYWCVEQAYGITILCGFVHVWKHNIQMYFNCNVQPVSMGILVRVRVTNQISTDKTNPLILCDITATGWLYYDAQF